MNPVLAMARRRLPSNLPSSSCRPEAGQREAQRCGYVAPVAVAACSTLSRGVARNLSSGGACLWLDEEFEVGDYVCVKFLVPGDNQTVEVLGIVRHREGQRHGVEFCVFPSDPEAATIRHLLAVAVGEAAASETLSHE